MSDREFTRGAILRRVVAGELTIREATPLLRVSYRQAKRLVRQRPEQCVTGRPRILYPSPVWDRRIRTIARHLEGNERMYVPWLPASRGM